MGCRNICYLITTCYCVGFVGTNSQFCKLLIAEQIPNDQLQRGLHHIRLWGWLSRRYTTTVLDNIRNSKRPVKIWSGIAMCHPFKFGDALPRNRHRAIGQCPVDPFLAASRRRNYSIYVENLTHQVECVICVVKFENVMGFAIFLWSAYIDGLMQDKRISIVNAL